MAESIKQSISLDDQFSTTKNVTSNEPSIETDLGCKYKKTLFLPAGDGRKGCGGLRTQGYFKSSIKSKPLISIITVVFNGETYVENTIQSVLRQSYDNVEYIIIDGGSTDATLDIIRKYGDQIDYWVSEKDSGIYDAMNKGIMLSQGEYIGIINSDDFYDEDTCRTVVEAFNKNEGAYLIHGDLRRLGKNDKTDSIYGSKNGFSDLLLAPFNHPTCFFHVDFYRKYGLYDQGFPTAADYDLMLRFKKEMLKDVYINKVLTNFRKVGVTSQSKFFPLVQIWALLKKNKYPWYKRCFAVGYRMARFIISSTLEVFELKAIRRKLRRYVGYHQRCE